MNNSFYDKNGVTKLKKKILFTLLILTAVFAFAEKAEKAEEAESEKEEFLYIVSNDELSYYFQSYNWLQSWEAGEVKVSDKEFAALYENQIGQETFTSMLFENFFRNTNNKDIQSQVKKYIQKKKLKDKPFEKALLKKYDSTAKEQEQSGKKVIQYSYKDKEFDENLDLFHFNEVHPFNDEFGLLLFNGIDWNILTWHSMETDEPTNDKEFFLMAGGGTNSITIKFQEIDNANIKSINDLSEISFVKNVANKYNDDWAFLELEHAGVLSNCGVDNYCIGYGLGTDTYISEIAAGDFVVCMYKKETNKVYLVHTYMNFSKINISYEIRNRLYNYLLFFTLFCYCD